MLRNDMHLSRRLAAAVCAASVWFLTPACAEVIEFPDAPFAMPAIVVPQFAERDFSIVDFGAKEGVKATEAFAKAMADCEAAGGGRVVVPKGKWLTGAVHFRNNCNLHLAEGAALEFTDDPADYLPVVHTSWEGVECLNYSPLIYAYGVTNVAITGKGTIAPRMDFWRTWFTRSPEHMKATECLYYWCSTNAPVETRRIPSLYRAHMRPHLIQFNRCGNVLLDGFRVRESPFWMIHLYHSENCVVRNLDTYARGSNNDGIDVEMTRNVLVENCHFDQGDDGVVLKAGRNADGWRIGRSTENVIVRDCELVNSHSLLGIGSELSGGIRNVWMTRCTVEDTFSMLRIKTGPRRGGFVENVFMDHCRGERTIRVFNIFMKYSAQWGKFPDFELRRTKIRNINISDCEAALASVGVELLGDRLMPPSGIRVRNVKIGRVVNSLSDIRNCLDVDLTGLSLLPNGEMPTDTKPRLFFAGDSTLDDHGQSLSGTSRDPYRSWGTSLQQFMVAGCKVRNYAKSGASTKSFIKSGQWSMMISDVKPGDYVAIQFGHNDQKRSSDFYLSERFCDPNGLFRENIRNMVKRVHSVGATPILLSPICRGTFDKDGKRLVDSTYVSDGVCLGSYRDAMKELSIELDCDYVDMNSLTRELMERVGRDEAMKFFVISTGLVVGKDGEPSKDITHPVQAGAEAFAKLFIDDVLRRRLSVAEMFCNPNAETRTERGK